MESEENTLKMEKDLNSQNETRTIYILGRIEFVNGTGMVLAQTFALLFITMDFKILKFVFRFKFIRKLFVLNNIFAGKLYI